MGIAQNGRGIQRLVYVDENRVPHIILTAYLGDQLVWDGHVSQVLQVPRARSTSQAYAPAVLADSVVAIPVARSYSEALVPMVTGGVTIAPPVALSTSEAYAPTLFADQLIDVPVAQSYSQAYAPDIRVVFGVTPPVALSSSQAYAPEIHASALVEPPAALSFSTAYAPQVGSYAIIEPPVALSTSQAYAPVMHADQVIQIVRATSTSRAYAPVMHGDQNIAVPRATSTSQAYAPQILAGGIFFDAYAADGKVNSNPSVSITTAAGATLIIVTSTNATGSTGVTVDGSTSGVTSITPTSNTLILWKITGLSAGAHTVAMTNGAGAVRSIEATSYTGVGVVGTGVYTTGNSNSPAVSPTGSGLVCVGGFYGTGVDTTTTATGTIRGQYVSTNIGGTNTRPLAFVDNTATPVGLTLGGSTSWQGVGVWLS